MQGWISVHRKIEECWVWFDEPFSKGQAWIDILLLANHAPKKCLVDGKLTVIGEGERLTSIRKLAERWQWSRDKTSKFLHLLEADEMIELKKSHHFTIIKVRNYGLYQGNLREFSATEQPQKSHGKATKQPQTDTNNNDNNENNENNIKPSNKSDELDLAFDKIYYKYPKKVGKSRAKQIYKALLTKGRKIDGKTVKFTHEDICAGLNVYYNDKTEPNNGEIGDTKYWMNFDTLMNRIQDYVERREELDE